MSDYPSTKTDPTAVDDDGKRKASNHVVEGGPPSKRAQVQVKADHPPLLFLHVLEKLSPSKNGSASPKPDHGKNDGGRASKSDGNDAHPLFKFLENVTLLTLESVPNKKLQGLVEEGGKHRVQRLLHAHPYAKQIDYGEEKHWDQQLHTLTTSVLKRVTPPQLNFRENDEVKAVPTFLGVTMLPNGNLLVWSKDRPMGFWVLDKVTMTPICDFLFHGSAESDKMPRCFHVSCGYIVCIANFHNADGDVTEEDKDDQIHVWKPNELFSAFVHVESHQISKIDEYDVAKDEPVVYFLSEENGTLVLHAYNFVTRQEALLPLNGDGITVCHLARKYATSEWRRITGGPHRFVLISGHFILVVECLLGKAGKSDANKFFTFVIDCSDLSQVRFQAHDIVGHLYFCDNCTCDMEYFLLKVDKPGSRGLDNNYIYIQMDGETGQVTVKQFSPVVQASASAFERELTCATVAKSSVLFTQRRSSYWVEFDLATGKELRKIRTNWLCPHLMVADEANGRLVVVGKRAVYDDFPYEYLYFTLSSHQEFVGL